MQDLIDCTYDPCKLAWLIRDHPDWLNKTLQWKYAHLFQWDIHS